MAMSRPPLTPSDCSRPRPNLYSYAGSRYQPNRCFAECQNMKSGATSTLTEFVVTPLLLECTHSGPAPIMNSTVFDSVHGFLNSKSTLHSVECRAKSGVTPASSSSRFSMGVTSTAAVGPKLRDASLTFQAAAPPSSTTAAGSFSADCPKATVGLKKIHAISRDLIAFSGSPVYCDDHRREEIECPLPALAVNRNNGQVGFRLDAT